VWHVACIGEMIRAYKILITKPKGRRLGTPRHTWDKHIRACAHTHTYTHTHTHTHTNAHTFV